MIGVDFANGFEKRDAVHSRHIVIGNDAIEIGGRQVFECVGGIHRMHHGKSLVFTYEILG